MTTPTPPAPTNPPEGDPTERTIQQLMGAVAAERSYVDGQVQVLNERLAGMDLATTLRLQVVDDIRTTIHEKVSELGLLHDQKFVTADKTTEEKFNSIDQQFTQRDKAVEAAFAASKEAASKQDEGNQKSIDKSEKSTADAIDKLSKQVDTEFRAIRQQQDDMKSAQAELRQLINGAAQNRAGGTEQKIDTRAMVMLGISAVLFLITVAGFVIALADNKPT